jgi:hypothetical protein
MIYAELKNKITFPGIEESDIRELGWMEDLLTSNVFVILTTDRFVVFIETKYFSPFGPSIEAEVKSVFASEDPGGSVHVRYWEDVYQSLRAQCDVSGNDIEKGFLVDLVKYLSMKGFDSEKQTDTRELRSHSTSVRRTPGGSRHSLAPFRRSM